MERSRGPNSIAQRKFIDDSGSDKVSDVLPVGKLVSSNMATSSIDVGEASVLRVRVAGSTFIAFSDDKAALDAATIDASYSATEVIELSAAGTYLIACPRKWARASTNPARIELMRA